MENLNHFSIGLLISTWVQYVFWIIIYGCVISAGIIGWKRNKNEGYIFILISSILSLMYHLPSIYFKGYYAVRRYTALKYGELWSKLSYLDIIIIPLIALLLVIGLFYLALKNNQLNK